MKVKTKSKMIPGYEYIERRSPEHEPNVVGLRLTVTQAIDFLYIAKGSIDELIGNWGGQLTKKMVEDVIRYYKENKEEVDSYISQSHAKSGMIIKDGRIIKQPDGK